MVGERQHYDALWQGDPDFRTLFGDPGRLLVRHAEGERAAALRRRRRRRLPRREPLPPAEAGRRRPRRGRVGARGPPQPRLDGAFGDTIVAACARPRTARAETIGRDDVERALAARAAARGADRGAACSSMLEEGMVLVSTSGEAVGRVNGLSVYDLGYHAFGKPTRITASAAPGQVGHHQRRARGEAVGEHLRQGRPDHHRLPAPPVRRPRPADADREPRLRAVVRGRRRRLGVDRRGGRAGLGAGRAAGRRRRSRSRARSTSTATCSRSAASTTRSPGSTRSARRAGSTAAGRGPAAAERARPDAAAARSSTTSPPAASRATPSRTSPMRSRSRSARRSTRSTPPCGRG